MVEASTNGLLSINNEIQNEISILFSELKSIRISIVLNSSYNLFIIIKLSLLLFDKLVLK
jgi:hypothetical protein